MTAFLRIAFLGLTLLAISSPAQAEAISLEVESSSVERDPNTNEVVVVIAVDPSATTALQNFTQRNKGRSVEIRLGTTVLLTARLVEEIKGGTIRANTKFNEEEAGKIAAQLTRGTLITLEDPKT